MSPDAAVAEEVDHAADRQPGEAHAEPEDEEDAEPEGRRRYADEHGDGDQLVLPAVLPDGGDDAEEDAEDAGEDERRAGKEKRRIEALPELDDDRLVEDVGAAEIAGQDVADPDQVLLGQRPVEAELLVQRLHVFGRGEGAEDGMRGVAGNQPDDEEDDDADAEDHRHDHQETAERVGEHQDSPDAKTWKRDAPLPLGGGGLRLLASVASLEAKGEGVTLAASALRLGVLSAAVTPSPRFSKLAALVKRNGPPPPRGRGRPRAWLRRLLMPRRSKRWGPRISRLPCSRARPGDLRPAAVKSYSL